MFENSDGYSMMFNVESSLPNLSCIVFWISAIISQQWQFSGQKKWPPMLKHEVRQLRLWRWRCPCDRLHVIDLGTAVAAGSWSSCFDENMSEVGLTTSSPGQFTTVFFHGSPGSPLAMPQKHHETSTAVKMRCHPGKRPERFPPGNGENCWKCCRGHGTDMTLLSWFWWSESQRNRCCHFLKMTRLATNSGMARYQRTHHKHGHS